MKNKVDRKINRIVKRINKDLSEDVFKDRFWIRQVKKQIGEDGLRYYLYEMIDREEPERNSYIKWIWGSSPFISSEIYEGINDFIVKSDFWAKYWKDESRYNIKLDNYRAKYNPMRSGCV